MFSNRFGFSYGLRVLFDDVFTTFFVFADGLGLDTVRWSGLLTAISILMTMATSATIMMIAIIAVIGNVFSSVWKHKNLEALLWGG